MQKKIVLRELTANSRLGSAIYDENNRLLLNKGQILTDQFINMLLQRGTEEVFIAESAQIEDLIVEIETWQEPAKVELDRGLTPPDFRTVHKELATQAERVEIRSKNSKGFPKEIKDLCKKLVQYTEINSNLDVFVLSQKMGRESLDNHCAHMINTAVLATEMGAWLKLDSDSLLDIVLAGYFHDIGKFQLPPELLQKKDKLTKQEWNVMRTHPQLGADILEKTKWVSQTVVNAVGSHHERMDGVGYPHQSQASEIPAIARIIAVAEAYDVLTSDQPYRSAVNPYAAIRKLRDKSFGELDPKMVQLIFNRVVQHYVGNFVELSNGQTGHIVFLSPSEPTLPLVQTEDGFVDLFSHAEIKIVNIYEDEPEKGRGKKKDHHHHHKK
ncbi:MAG: HD-GYP domain-containing protein [Acidobacteriota bacterium]